MKLIDRPLYLQRLMDVKGTPEIKVITDIRDVVANQSS